jgi:hypothetical protein|tara:strand:+ start:5102 stop:5446 length:345 start_codon:yes stop_codon:yes gene_type:complete
MAFRVNKDLEKLARSLVDHFGTPAIGGFNLDKFRATGRLLKSGTFPNQKFISRGALESGVVGKSRAGAEFSRPKTPPNLGPEHDAAVDKIVDVLGDAGEEGTFRRLINFFNRKN